MKRNLQIDMKRDLCIYAKRPVYIKKNMNKTYLPSAARTMHRRRAGVYDEKKPMNGYVKRCEWICKEIYTLFTYVYISLHIQISLHIHIHISLHKRCGYVKRCFTSLYISTYKCVKRCFSHMYTSLYISTYECVQRCFSHMYTSLYISIYRFF